MKLISWPLIIALLFFGINGSAQKKAHRKFQVVAFYTAKNDLAHISFVEEANKWFKDQSLKNDFDFFSTNDWNLLNEKFLADVEVVMFLDTRPDSVVHRIAFEKYMKNGGAWMGFHFAGFALTPSAYPQNWDWYHREFIATDQYKGNTWRPTKAILRTENKNHPVTNKLPELFESAPNEWYSWSADLKDNRDIEILLSIDSTSFPLGTGPKQHEIWHEGYYPVAWTNKKYKMIYVNMGHNDMDYGGTNKTLSSSFSSEIQNQFFISSLLWLGQKQ
jgi:uncharacterized protein